MSETGMMGVLIAILLSTFRVSVPLIFTSMGGILSERAGVVNIALEGLMLVGAFAAATTAALTHSPWLGALAGIGAGVLLAAIYALFVIEARADQIVAGTAINLLAFGVTPLLAKAFFETAGTTPALEIHDRFGNEPLYLALVVVIGIAFWFRHSKLGLWVGFAGEHPEALSTAGIRVKAVRWFGVLAAGALAGLGGVTLSIFLSSSFSRGMTAGRGFMALAALIFGKWRPIPTLFACLFFGLTDAVQIRLQGVPVFGDEPIPVQFIQILPYVFTVLVLAGFMGKSRPPKALGAPWLGMIAAIGFFFLQGCESRRTPSAPPSPVAARNTSGDAQLLAETIRLVLDIEPKQFRLFPDYLSSLEQGASFEGILNGWFHSSEYRELEMRSPVATSAARAFFIDEFLRLEANLSALRKSTRLGRPLELSGATGRPLPETRTPTGEERGKVLYHSTSEVDYTSEATRKRCESIFANSSLPILKRVLFETLLLRFEAEGVAPTPSEDLVKLYAETAARLGNAGVDFGLSNRNLPDPDFHRKWMIDLYAPATRARAKDRALWEFSNRYFRVLNQSAPPREGASK